MDTSSRSFLGLPLELILEISDHLAPDGILALKLTHPVLNTTLPLESRLRNVTLSRCARIAIRGHLSPRYPSPSHLRCILCKERYEAKMFMSSSSVLCLSPAAVAEDPPPVIELPHGLCSWHVARLVRKVYTRPDGRNEWVSRMRDMCMHCGEIRGWGECDCGCKSCGSRVVRTYSRYLNNSTECHKYWFYRKASQGETTWPLMVKEECSDPDGATIHLPVQDENRGTKTSSISSARAEPELWERWWTKIRSLVL